jgi:hypothetical protein
LETTVSFEKDTELVRSTRLNDIDTTVVDIGLYRCLRQDALSEGKTWANLSGRKNTARRHRNLHRLKLRRGIQP